MANSVQMDMQLNHWRGYSAYELAVQNGFPGTVLEWLESLKGMDGQTTSVNGVAQQGGDVTLTGADIPVSASDGRKLSDLARVLDGMAEGVKVSDSSVDLGGKYLDNALFR